MASAIEAGRVCIRPHPVLGFVLLAGAALLAAPAAYAQEAEHEAAREAGAELEHSEEPVYRHYISFFGGLATHTERNETGGAMGISYVYGLSEKWAVGLVVEYSTSSLERDIVFLPVVVFEPVERMEFTLGMGVERAHKDEIEDGAKTTVEENEALMRLGVGYAFELRPGVYLLPEFNADIGGSRVTYVYGLVMSVGL